MADLRRDQYHNLKKLETGHNFWELTALPLRQVARELSNPRALNLFSSTLDRWSLGSWSVKVRDLQAPSDCEVLREWTWLELTFVLMSAAQRVR